MHSAFPLLALYQCVEFHSIPFYIFRDMLQTSFYCKNKKRGSYSENTGARVMILAFCNSLYSPLSVYQVSLNYLHYFQRYALDKSVMDGLTFYTNVCNSTKSDDRVMVLAFCSSSISPLTIYQVSFHSLLYFQRYAPNKLFIAKTEKREVTP